MCKLFTPSEICSSVWGLWKVLCLDGTYSLLDPFPAAVRKRRIYAPLSLFLAASTPNSKLSSLQSWHSRGKPESPKFLTLLYLLSTYLYRFLLFVCGNKFTITLWNIKLFVYRKTGIFYFLMRSGYLLTSSFLAFIYRYRTHFTGSNEGRSTQKDLRLNRRQKR